MLFPSITILLLLFSLSICQIQPIADQPGLEVENKTAASITTSTSTSSGSFMTILVASGAADVHMDGTMTIIILPTNVVALEEKKSNIGQGGGGGAVMIDDDDSIGIIKPFARMSSEKEEAKKDMKAIEPSSILFMTSTLTLMCTDSTNNNTSCTTSYTIPSEEAQMTFGITTRVVNGITIA